MSSKKFKKLQAFWRSQEENKLVPGVKCVSFHKRTLINRHSPQPSTIETPNQAQLHTEAVEESKVSPVYNDEFYQQWLHDKNTLEEAKTELEFENRLMNSNAINIEINSSPSEKSVRSKVFIKKPAETKVLDALEEKNINTVFKDVFHRESWHDKSSFREVKTELVFENQFPNQVSSLSKTCEEVIQIQCFEKGAELENPVSEENFDNGISDDKCIIEENTSELEYKTQLLHPDSIINDSESLLSDVISNDGYDSCSSYCEPYDSIPVKSRSGTTAYINDTSEGNFFNDEWFYKENHIFVLSFAGKPIYSLHGHGYEDKISSLFAPIQCFVSIVEGRKDIISSIEAEGIKFVFLIRNALYLVAASRGNRSEHYLKLQLREMYNRIVFLLTSKSLNRIFKYTPGYDLRKQLRGNYNLISNQLTTKIKISNSIFTLFTNSIRVLPLVPTSRSTITRIIKRKCSKIKNLAFAVLIVDDQLVTLVRLKNYTIHSADIRLIFNLMECSEHLFNNFYLWMLPICLPNFNKDCYLHAYISNISDKCEAFLILLSSDRNMTEEMSKAHRDITKTLHGNNWFETISQQIKHASQQGNGFNIGAIKIPELWHFLFIPKSSNHQLLCSKIIPPYTSLAEFTRLEAIYRDLHDRMHNKTRRLELIFEVKEKEVAIALDTDIAEIYAVFDPLVNTFSVAKEYIDKLVGWITAEQKAYFIRKYPKF